MYYRLFVGVQKNIHGGPLNGTKYDFSNSCSQCGTGALPAGPRFLKINQIPKAPIFQTLDGEIIFSDDLVKQLHSIGKELFVEVHEAKTGKTLPLWELRTMAVLPRFAKSTTGFEVERSCEECHRDGYFEIPNIPLKLVYPTNSLSVFNSHVLMTYERFGNSQLRSPIEASVFARPLFLVSKEFQEIITRAGILGVAFEEVIFE